MPRRYDHIDLRVKKLAAVRDFYERLLPALGFTLDMQIPGWLQYEMPATAGEPGAFFGVAESAGHAPNENRIAFWAGSPAEVDRLAAAAAQAGARNIEGPAWESSTYYAVFFEDPCGNRFECCHRVLKT